MYYLTIGALLYATAISMVPKGYHEPSISAMLLCMFLWPVILLCALTDNNNDFDY